MGLEGRLTLLVFLNILKVHVEQVRGIERASLSFWVELSGEDRSRIVDETCTVLDIGTIIGIWYNGYLRCCCHSDLGSMAANLKATLKRQQRIHGSDW
jgi:hypothetical protein